MCNRYNATLSIKQAREIFKNAPDDWFEESQPAKDGNFYPLSTVPVVANKLGEQAFGNMRWGIKRAPRELKPGEKRGRPNLMNNARLDTILKLGSWKEAFQRRRCILPVSHFTEYVTIKGQTRKAPINFSRIDGKPLLAAGLWNRWKDETDQQVTWCSMIMDEPNEIVSKAHDRMPVFINEDQIEWYLNAPQEEAEFIREQLMKNRYPADLMEGVFEVLAPK